MPHAHIAAAWGAISTAVHRAIIVAAIAGAIVLLAAVAVGCWSLATGLEVAGLDGELTVQ